MESTNPETIRAAATTAFVMIVLVAVVLPASAADPDRPHSHTGVLPAYKSLPEITLDPKQLDRLARGKLVTMTVVDAGGNGRGVAVIDIAAPCDVVWSRILGFDQYPEWVGPVKETEVYTRDGHVVHTRTKISGFLYKFEYYLVNTFYPDAGLLTWTLDYDRYSDFDDNVGAWFVEEHPEKEGWSRAWFSTDLKLRKPPPQFLMKWIKKQGLKDATRWVKRESEKVMTGDDGVDEDVDRSHGWE